MLGGGGSALDTLGFFNVQILDNFCDAQNAIRFA